MSRPRRLTVLLLAALFLPMALAGCDDPADPGAAAGGAAHPGGGSPPVEAYSLLGEPLHRPRLDDDFKAQQEALYSLALTSLGERPKDPEALIWVGRRAAYLGRYRQAIWTYSRGVDTHRGEPRLYRHRGHRYLTVRRLDAAIADLERAAALVEGKPDEVEPDGLPNARNVPTSTLQSNIWYHLGLARYLGRDFEGALDAYRHCLEVSKNPDMLVATSHWLYMTLRRLGRDAEAAAVLVPIDAGLDVIENQAYHQLLLLYRGERQTDALLAAAREAGDAAFATTGYGVGNWHLCGGRREPAFEIFRRIVATDAWPSFGYIAAEAELKQVAGR